MISFEEDLRQVINRHSAEAPSGTPDFILATYLTNCLKAYNEAVTSRAEWRGESCELNTIDPDKGKSSCNIHADCDFHPGQYTHK